MSQSSSTYSDPSKLYPIIPPLKLGADFSALEQIIAASADTSPSSDAALDIVSLLLCLPRGEGAGDDALRQRYKESVAQAQSAGIAVLVEDEEDGEHSFAQDLAADGVHFNFADLGQSDMASTALEATIEQKMAKARERLGDNALIGAFCGTSRHSAMHAGELMADYVAFGPIERFDIEHSDIARLGAESMGEDEQSIEIAHMTALELISWWAELFESPVIAWQPANLELACRCAEQGADFIAPLGAIWNHENGPLAALQSWSSSLKL